MLTRIPRPEAGEYYEYYDRYIRQVANESDAVAALQRQVAEIDQLARLTPEQAAFRYADGKWSVRQVVGHLADAERIFAYRALRAARGDRSPLPSFDENRYVETANFDGRAMADVANELAAVRQASLALFSTLDPGTLESRTVASDHEVSVRALAFIIAGHTVHHLTILRERYGVAAA